MLLRNTTGYLVEFLYVLNTVAKDLRLIFWIDPIQKQIYEDIDKTLKEIEALHLEVEIEDSVIEVVHETDYDKGNMEKFCEILSSRGVSLVLDFTYNKWHAGIEIIDRFGIPYLRVERILTPFLQALHDFVQQKGGNEIVMIFENSQARDEALYHMIDGYTFRTLLLNVEEDSDYVERMKRLRPSPTYYAIFATGFRMNTIFEKILGGNLFERPKEWHFVFLDGRDRSFKFKKQVEYANKITFNPKLICKTLGMKESYCTSGFSWQRSLLLEIIRKLSELPVDLLPPLAIECNMTGDTLWANSQWDVMDLLDLSEFLRLSHRPDVFDEKLPDPITYAVNISMNFYSNAHEAVTDLAVWQSGQLLKINQTITKPKRFLRIGVTEAYPWNFYVRDPTTGNITKDAKDKPIWQGYCIDLIVTLAQKMNFDYELIAPVEGKFGKRDPKTGAWDGIIGDLVRGETNFAATALKMYTDREEVIDFIAPYFETTGISIVIRKPLRQTSLFKFMTVLRVEVWFSIVAALTSTAVLMWLMDKYSPYSYRNNKEAYEYPCRDFTLRECFWFALTSFTPQGGGEAPKAVSGRVLVAAYWLFVVLMLATFTANLAAFLTVERMQTPVQSLEQLSRQSRINYTVVEGSDVHQYFINMKFAEDTLYRMWKEAALNESADYHKFRVWDYPIKEQYGNILAAINSSIPVQSAAEGYRKVSEHIHGDFAFIHDSSEIKYELTRNCNLTEIGEVFGEQPYAVAIQQGSNLADELIYSLLELQKDHYFEELKSKYWNYSHLQCPLTEEQEGISLDSLGGVFIATLCGLGLAMLTLLCEILYYKRKEKQLERLHRHPSVRQVQPARRLSSSTWHTGAISVNKTPPPSFDVATFRGRQIPSNITLGSDEFKPRRLVAKSRNPPNMCYTWDQDELPPYIE